MQHGHDEAAGLAPRPVRYAVAALLTALLAGAIVLAVLRGPAILVDLAGSVKAFFCL